MTNINKKLSKIVILLIIIQFIFAIMSTYQPVRADGGLGDIISGADDFLNAGQNTAVQGGMSSTTGDATTTIKTPTNAEIKAIIDNVYNILFPLGVMVTVIIGAVLGIKFMMASVEDKAKIKESLVPYIIGCFVIYGAFGIWKLAITIFSAIG